MNYLLTAIVIAEIIVALLIWMLGALRRDDSDEGPRSRTSTTLDQGQTAFHSHCDASKRLL
jgi:hypothetical protein